MSHKNILWEICERTPTPLRTTVRFFQLRLSLDVMSNKTNLNIMLSSLRAIHHIREGHVSNLKSRFFSKFATNPFLHTLTKL